MICCYCFCLDQIYDLSKKISYYLDMCIFFIDFSCYLFVGFLGSVCKFFGDEGAKYINLRARIKILFVNTHTSIFFSKVGGGGWLGLLHYTFFFFLVVKVKMSHGILQFYFTKEFFILLFFIEKPV